MKRLKIKELFFLGILAVFFLLPTADAWADDDPVVPGAKEASPKNEPMVPKKAEAAVPSSEPSELDKLKKEWEEVREQQVQMIREKEDQLEKLKEEIFAKMKAPSAPVVPAAQPGTEAERAALRTERQKFFSEMNRQKEKLRQLQASLDEKEKQLAAERERFEQEKKKAAR